MEVLVVADGHYYLTKEKDIYVDSVYDYGFYERYLQSFDHVNVAIRANKSEYSIKGKKKVNGKGIGFYIFPDYRGPLGMLKRYSSVSRLIRKACSECDCGIFRIPSALGIPFAYQFAKKKKPFAIEVVADPWENFKPEINSISLTFTIARFIWTWKQKRLCKIANGVAYVTEKSLQRRYPPHSKAFTTNYSSVDLQDDSFASPKKWSQVKTQFVISHAANDISDYGKGHVILIQALEILIKRGHDVIVRFIGDGAKIDEFKELARKKGLSGRVLFLGRLPNGAAVRQEIRQSDLFVFPSASEGLPRVLLEAMAEGLPCISTNVGGIPELLPGEYLFKFGDYIGIANCVEKMITNLPIMEKESVRNISTAKKYSKTILDYRRKDFYNKLREQVERQG